MNRNKGKGYVLKYPDKNRYVTEGDITRLTIARRNGDEHAVILDAANVPKARRRTWRVSTQKLGRMEAVTGPCDAQISLGRYLFAPPDGHVVHYLNGNPFDNRMVNVEVVTPSELPKANGHGISGEKNVIWRGDQRHRPWTVVFRQGTRAIIVGSFANIPEAVEARDAYLAAS